MLIMGIPLLTQDLMAYAELVSLGEDTAVTEDGVRISRIVIDGPSLVYHVYANLLRQSNAATRPTLVLPTYREICVATESLISTLKFLGVEM